MRTVHHGDALAVLEGLPEASVHCCVTSPPYWGLRDYGVPGQIGLEPTPEAYVAKLVEVFREVRRVLRDDGTLWLNLGDCYVAQGNGDQGANGQRADRRHTQRTLRTGASGNKGNNGADFDGPHRGRFGLAAKQLVGIPWRVAFALQADGWWLRSDIIWAKPNPMPESVRDRPTKAHEYVFLLAKNERYFFDQEAVREPSLRAGDLPGGDNDRGAGEFGVAPHAAFNGPVPISRNVRSVWTIATEPFPEAHFATFPTELARRCIVAGTSEKGCCAECDAPFVRETKIKYENPGNRTTNGPRSAERKHLEYGTAGYAQRLERRSTTTGWMSSCDHEAAGTVPCTVLDPFAGAGTTGLVADRLGRSSVGIELNPKYAEMARRRIVDDAPLFNSRSPP